MNEMKINELIMQLKLGDPTEVIYGLFRQHSTSESTKAGLKVYRRSLFPQMLDGYKHNSMEQIFGTVKQRLNTNIERFHSPTWILNTMWYANVAIAYNKLDELDEICRVILVGTGQNEFFVDNI
jgi:hypothetical protein